MKYLKCVLLQSSRHSILVKTGLLSADHLLTSHSTISQIKIMYGSMFQVNSQGGYSQRILRTKSIRANS